MAFGGNKGFRAYMNENDNALACLFCEELGAVIECEDRQSVLKILGDAGIPAYCLGSVISDNKVVVDFCGRIVLKESMTDMRALWERTSDALDMLQANPDCVRSEQKTCHHLLTPPPYLATFKPQPTPEHILNATQKPRVAIIREKGSNGDKEMAAAFYSAGFEPWDVTMTDLLEGRVSLDNFRGIAFVGGFANADVFDAAKGWAGVIRYNERVSQELERFRKRADTFSLGICNGCQLMALLGWVPGFELLALDEAQQPRFIRNVSGRFESRFTALRIEKSNAIMLKGMEGSVLGAWSAHGEGQFHANSMITERILSLGLAPLRYVDPEGQPTTVYPFNPNGSPHGIAAVCTEDGRGLAIMPHEERTFLPWQWPWMPESFKRFGVSPWLKMFQNAYEWCMR
jgi:phosphoribosylformylglycinamidine synthase